MESIWATSLECASQWKLLLLLLLLRFYYYQLNYATVQRIAAAAAAAESASFSIGLHSSVFSLQFQFRIQFRFGFILDTKIQCYDTKSMSQSSIVECWLHKWWRCLPLCIGPWCSIVRWCPIVQSDVRRLYLYNLRVENEFHDRTKVKSPEEICNLCWYFIPMCDIHVCK